MRKEKKIYGLNISNPKREKSYINRLIGFCGLTLLKRT